MGGNLNRYFSKDYRKNGQYKYENMLNIFSIQKHLALTELRWFKTTGKCGLLIIDVRSIQYTYGHRFKKLYCFATSTSGLELFSVYDVRIKFIIVTTYSFVHHSCYQKITK